LDLQPSNPNKKSSRKSPGKQKSMCLAAASGVAVAAAKLLLARWESWHIYENIGL